MSINPSSFLAADVTSSQLIGKDSADLETAGLPRKAAHGEDVEHARGNRSIEELRLDRSSQSWASLRRPMMATRGGPDGGRGPRPGASKGFDRPA